MSDDKSGIDSYELIVYVDGACRRNGQTDARGGCGVYWGDYHPMNTSESLTGEKQTNNRAEMSAAIIALTQAAEIGMKSITVVSDSRYVKEGISNWISTWKSNGWKSEKKGDVLNKDLWVILDNLQTSMVVTWKWVEGHGSTTGNIKADALAGIGVSEASQFWQDRASIISPTSVVTCVSCDVTKTAEKKVCSYCNTDSGGTTIQCNDCKSLCHFSCTRLPRYQLFVLRSSHRKYSCESCLSIPQSFATDIDDEVSLRRTAEPAKLPTQVSKQETSQLQQVLSQHSTDISNLLDKYQSTTIHALESSFVKAIEKFTDVQSSSKYSDQQSQINQLLRDKENFLREKENLLKSVKKGDQGNGSISTQQLQEIKRELDRVSRERDDLKISLNKTTTEFEITKSKLQTDQTVLRQKLDAMASRNEILNNESLSLEKLLSMKNENIVEVEAANRDLKTKIDQLQAEVLSWKLHASRADDSLVEGTSETAPIIISGNSSIPEKKEMYSSVTKGRAESVQGSTPVASKQQVLQSRKSPSLKNFSQDSSQENASKHNNKEKVILIGTSNIRYLSSRYIAGDKYHVHKETKYTVSEAKAYIDSLTDDNQISKFILHLSCNDIKTASPDSHAESYCQLVKSTHEKYPRAQVIVSLGLPRKDTTISNKIEVANAKIKELLFNVPNTTLCDNSNLAYRGQPEWGVLESDGIHLSRKGVFVLNDNFRSCVYGSSSERNSRGSHNRKSGGWRPTSYRRFGNNY